MFENVLFIHSVYTGKWSWSFIYAKHVLHHWDKPLAWVHPSFIFILFKIKFHDIAMSRGSTCSTSAGIKGTCFCASIVTCLSNDWGREIKLITSQSPCCSILEAPTWPDVSDMEHPYNSHLQPSSLMVSGWAYLCTSSATAGPLQAHNLGVPVSPLMELPWRFNTSLSCPSYSCFICLVEVASSNQLPPLGSGGVQECWGRLESPQTPF